MSSLKYLICHTDHPVSLDGVNSGAERATLALARGMAELGLNVVIAGKIREGSQKRDGIQYIDVGARYAIEDAISQISKEGQYHLISAGRALAIMISKNDPHCLSRTLICHDPSGNASGVSAQTLSGICDQVISVSEAQKGLIVQAGFPADKVVVVNNGVDKSLFAPASTVARDPFKLVFVGALVRDKGIELLINSFIELKKVFPKLTLDVYGSSSMWSRGALFDEKSVEAQVSGIKFHGAVTQDKVANAYRSAGLCVLPSIWFDSYPLTAVEAQASGCPVVGFDIGGIPEAIKDGKSGVIIKDISFESLTTTLGNLLKSPDKIEALWSSTAREIYAIPTWKDTARTITGLINSKTRVESPTTSKGRFGYLSTWNQRCGIANYARLALEQFEKGSYIVLAEDAPEEINRTDEEFVVRCWKKKGGDFSKVREAIREQNIRLLHINIHEAGVLPTKELVSFLGELRTSGVKVVIQLHTTFTLDQKLTALATVADSFIVHTEQNKLQLVGNGAAPSSVSVIPLGIAATMPHLDKVSIKRELGIPATEKVISCFGFIQPHKGMDTLIDGIEYLNRRNIASRGYIVGGVNKRDPGSEEYLAALKEYALKKGVAQKIHFVNGFVDDETLRKYIAVSDVVLMNYLSQHHESSAACLEALNLGAIVATSLAPAFTAYGNAVWNITSGYPTPLSLELLLTNTELQAELRRNIEVFRNDNSWTEIRNKVVGIYNKLNFTPEAQTIVSARSVMIKSASTDKNSKKLRVLMQNRPNIFSQPGGDTVVMEKTRQGLINLGVEVIVDIEAKEDPRNYDIVHLFNFATPDYTRALAERIYPTKTPYVVTTMYEDVPSFHNQSHVIAELMMQYVERGQDRNWFRANKPNLNMVRPCNRFENSWTAEHAAGLFVSGANEGATLQRDYKKCGRIFEMKLGCEVAKNASPDLFINKYGIKDFILCVGRIESRKNQLMLLKALEDVDIPVVIASSGFTYQPDYAQAVRNFKRRGQTFVLDRLDPEMLASAYCAAKVHALPSWYELPGIVSLEGAFYGCNVVVSDAGTARDYLGESAFYCDAWDEDSIRKAVLSAYSTPYRTDLKSLVLQNNWQSLAVNTLSAYRQILGLENNRAVSDSLTSKLNVQGDNMASTYDMDTTQTDFQDLLEKGELAIEKKQGYEALTFLSKAEKINPNSVRLLKAMGVLHMTMNNISESERFFEKAIKTDPQDVKSLVGRGMCEIMKKSHFTAYDYFVRALRIKGEELIAIHQLIECSFALDRFDDITSVLENYVLKNPNDVEMRYCLAGCYYKIGKVENARVQLSSVLAKSPNHRGATELKSKIESSAAQESFKSAVPTPSVSSSSLMNKEAASGPVASAPSNKPMYRNNDIDLQLAELDEEKRTRNLEAVKQGCERIIYRGEASPDQIEYAKVLKAEVFILEGQIDRAVKIYQEVISINPNCSRALCGQAALQANAGDWERAEELFVQAKIANPKNDIAYAGLGMCAFNSKNHMRAWDFYNRALSINPENLRALLGIIELGYPMKRLAEVEAAIKGYLELHPADVNFIYSLAGCYFAQERLEEALEEIEKVLLFEADNNHALELKDLINSKLGRASQFNSRA